MVCFFVFLLKAYPLQVVMFGDMGKTHGSPTLPHLFKEARSGENAALIHVGDFAYDLQSDNGMVCTAAHLATCMRIVAMEIFVSTLTVE